MPGASRERFRLQTAQPLKTGARSTLGPARPLTPLSICGLFSSPVLLSLTPLAGYVTLCEPGLLRTVFVGEQIPFYMKTVLSLSPFTVVQDGSLLSRLRIGCLCVCPHSAFLFFRGPVQPATGQRKCKPKVYYILFLTGLNISTVFTISPAL